MTIRYALRRSPDFGNASGPVETIRAEFGFLTSLRKSSPKQPASCGTARRLYAVRAPCAVRKTPVVDETNEPSAREKSGES
jgi:hypothetical protein